MAHPRISDEPIFLIRMDPIIDRMADGSSEPERNRRGDDQREHERRERSALRM